MDDGIVPLHLTAIRSEFHTQGPTTLIDPTHASRPELFCSVCCVWSALVSLSDT